MPHKIIILALGFVLASGCNEASFSGKNPQKGNKKDVPQQLGPDHTGDANPGDPVDCTGKSAQECRDAKGSPNTPSFRTVDCTGASPEDCEKAKDLEKAKDKDSQGDNNSEIRVVDDSKSKDGDKDVGIGDKDKIKKGKFFCIGGLGRRVSYVTKTRELAQKCIDFGNAKPCANDAGCNKDPLIIFDCYCEKDDGIPFTKTSSCYRYNPLKSSPPATGCTAR